MVSDVARAFFEAPARRTICVELPEEETHEGDEVGLLLQSLHGTRDASANFQEEVRKVLTKAGFKRGKYNPSTYYHEKMGIKAMVHGDDFISSGSRKSLRWFRQVLESRFEVSTVVVVGFEQDHQDGPRRMALRSRSTTWTIHPQDMVRHPEKQDPELRRSRACGNGQDEL